ncbi:MAG: hypothetical protein ACREDY_21075 [Bradyrhizobium sp.]
MVGKGNATYEEARWIRILLASALPLALIIVIAIVGIGEMIGGSRTAQSPAQTALQVFTVLLTAGFASMATIQVAKSQFGLRGLFQRRQLQRWFGDDGFQALREALSLSKKSEISIFDLPIEQLAAQISAAAEFVLTEPDGDDLFLYALTHPASPGVADDTLSQHYRLRAAIDQLQATVGYRWRNYVRSTAMWLSGLYGLAIVESSQVAGFERGLDILASLLVGGFVSWLARDIVAAIERLRG